MIQLKDRIYGFPVERIWFWDGNKVKSNAVVLRFIRCTPNQVQPIKSHKIVDVNYTLINDLAQDEKDIFANFNKNYRYEIRRADKEGAEISIFESKKLRDDPEILLKFERAYNAFCDTLQNETVRANYNHEQIIQCIDQDGVILTRATQNGAIVYHLYYVDGHSAVLDYSVSDFRNANVDKASAGRLNKLLHWEDMKMFKIWGYSEYDWGNVSAQDMEMFNGIDKFKAGFGGIITEQHSASLPNSWLGQLIVAVIGLRKGK